MPRRSVRAAIGAVVAFAAVTASCSSGGDPAAGPGQAGSSLVIGGDATTTTLRPQFERDLVPYAGLGAWVDVFDYAPQYTGGSPAISPADVSEMSRRGVKTIFLQATRWDDDSPNGIVDEKLIGEFLAKAHELGMRVVGWYLPDFEDIERDLQRTMQIVDLRAGEHRFDGVAVDIEYTEGLPDPVARNDALVAYSRRLRNKVGDLPVAAVVLTAVHLEVVNQRFWPDFPYAKLAEIYDVWMPMAYWSGRVEKYHSGYLYVKESVDRLRANLGKADAPVAPVGGIADEVTNDEMREFAKALADMGAIGGSFYDWSTMAPNKQALAQQLFTDGVASKLPGPPPVGSHPVFSEADLTTTTSSTTTSTTSTSSTTTSTTVPPSNTTAPVTAAPPTSAAAAPSTDTPPTSPSSG